jgi:drug/metabolite transporter (DMT)-like permease
MSVSSPRATSSSTLRILALVFSVLCSSFAALFAKYALESFSPFTMTALRVWIASLVMLPIALRAVPGGLRWSSFLRALPMSLCYTGNITLFALGIGFTTALTSQLLYLLVPVLVLIGARLFFKEALTPAKVIGTALGIVGVCFVLLGSLQGQLANSLGTPLGNILILLAALSWSAFSLLAQRQSRAYHPLELSCYALLTSSAIIPLLILPELLRHQALHSPLSGLAVIGALGLALVVSASRDLSFQWGVKGSSAFIASTMGFLGPFLTVAYAIPLLGERLSASLLISGALILAGLFFAVILPARQQQRERTLAELAAPESLALPDQSAPQPVACERKDRAGG